VVSDVEANYSSSREQRSWLREHGIRSAWSIPLPSKNGEPVGAIVLLHDAPHRPAPNVILVFQLYAQHAAMALDNARLPTPSGASFPALSGTRPPWRS